MLRRSPWGVRAMDSSIQKEACVCAYTHVHVYVCVSPCVHAYVCMRVYVCVHGRMCMCVHERCFRPPS